MDGIHRAQVKVKISVLQGMQAPRVARVRGSHIS
jgi:hypothetical protein